MMTIEALAAPLPVAATYDAAADHYDAPPLSFWTRHGRRAAGLAAIEPGETVLDAGCGTGASALPAAVAAGPMGSVTGIDVAEAMLAMARKRAHARRLANVAFRRADMADPPFGASSVDVVIAMFSIFFVPDMEAQTARLWRLIKPGGRLVVGVWGPEAFEPGGSIFAEEVQGIRPGVTLPPRPWQRLTAPDGLRRMLTEGGTAEPCIVPIPDTQALIAPADFWTIALGSGFRGTIDQLASDEREVLRDRVTARLAADAVMEINTGALVALARKPL